eukprot:CAMPEP_0175268520 /NCGR_PEP_ID=MMETSP0093-20121207/44392_1 /TAXON_ID=311494 /ORGANISM="Alexandrium monilatum, Strain CCMP3105" /LENGTH=266 /DNA_ID=CAMNT_0016563161 /DNA_START=54 /DNA_END=854 /DNA_ORIENTATION=-
MSSAGASGSGGGPGAHPCAGSAVGGQEQAAPEVAEFGGLILRGNRCVLVRSLEGRWKGMRVPSVVARPGEQPRATAVRAVTELCDVDADEVTQLRGISPVSSYAVRDGKVRAIPIYALYSVRPPPPGPLEAADEEDPEDRYDWYTLPRALAALAADMHARAALAALACALAAGAAAGAVPDRWGGVFGQEWAAAALQLLPCPGGAGLALQRATEPFEAPPRAARRPPPKRRRRAEAHEVACGSHEGAHGAAAASSSTAVPGGSQGG